MSQNVVINGVVVANDDVENIHVINKSSRSFTTTNLLGAFKISAKYKDTLQFTSVRYKTAILVISYSTIQNKTIEIFLEEQINLLDEVVVGKVLTGDLESDLKNFKVERPIDFYDLGLPGYKGPQKTQSERRAFSATKAQQGIIPIVPLINLISGRTKMLKERVKLERNTELMESIKEDYFQDFFNTNLLDDKYKEEFLYFYAEDENFNQRCRGKSGLEILEYLEEKLMEYKENLKTRKD